VESLAFGKKQASEKSKGKKAPVSSEAVLRAVQGEGKKGLTRRIGGRVVLWKKKKGASGRLKRGKGQSLHRQKKLHAQKESF